MLTGRDLRIAAVLYSLVFLSLTSKGQNQANIWYFGRNAGISFNASGTPQLLSNGQLNTSEGCASVCDKRGNLLMYTDGITVWDRNHNIMPYGRGLKGHSSATQSALIVPFPGDSNRYYLFTVTALGATDGLQYSIVDLNQNGGMGAVDSLNRNKQLLYPVTEKLSAIMCQDGSGYWLLAHGVGNNFFYAWKLGYGGIDSIPVISRIGAVHGPDQGTIGQMKSNIQGDRLAVCIHGSSIVELFDFNQQTGRLSHPLSLNVNKPYGCEFSPGSRFLYVSEISSNVWQFDLSCNTSPEIQASAYKIFNSVSDYFGALQLGPDYQIYVVVPTKYLAVIHEPDRLRAACAFQFAYLDIPEAILGLPGFIQQYFKVNCPPPPALGHDTLICLSEHLTLKATYPRASYRWQDGSTDSIFVVKKAGSYWVERSIYGCVQSDTVKVSCFPDALFSFGRKDTTLCEGETWTWSAPYPNSETVMWRDGSTSPTYSTRKNEKVWVVMKQGKCIISDTIQVKFISPPSFSLGHDTVLCPGEVLVIKVPEEYGYEWMDGNESNTYIVGGPGIYSVVAYNKCGSLTRSIKVDYHKKMTLDLGADDYLCLGKSRRLCAGDSSMEYSYLWNTGATAHSITVSEGGKYYVTKTCACGSMTDTINLVSEDCSCPTYIPNVFTPNTDGMNDFWLPSICPSEQYSVSIYNRWGELVFHSDHQAQGWDGRYKGELVPDGPYLYYINAFTKYREHKYLSGTISVMR